MNNNPEWKVWWDEENKVVRHWSRGINDEIVASDSTAEMKSQLEKHSDAAGVLVDIRDVIRVNGKARNIFGDFVKNLDKKVAFYGANRIMKIVVKLVFGAAGRLENFKIFGSEEEAFEWLMQR
jgi:hypothetical protein